MTTKLVKAARTGVCSHARIGGGTVKLIIRMPLAYVGNQE